MDNIIKNFVIILLWAIIGNSISNAQTSVIEETKINQLLDSAILTQEEREWIVSHPTITATSKLDAAPMEFTRAGENIGFSIDYLNLVAGKVGLNVDYITGYTWSELLEKLKRREIDVSHNLVQSAARDEYLDFTTPYLEVDAVIFGKMGSPKINSLEGLKGKRILILDGWAAQEEYKVKFPDLNIVKVSSSVEALLSVSRNENDLYFIPDMIGNYLLETEFISGVSVLGDIKFMDVVNLDYVKIASRNDWPLLNSILQKGMMNVTDEEYNILADRWFVPRRIDSLLNLSTAELKWLEENPIIKIAVDPTIRPVEFINADGEVDGVVGDYLDILSEKLNVQFDWIGNKNFDEGLESIRLGQADMMPALTPSAERAEYLSFTDKYMDVNSVIFAREDGDIFGNVEGLYGHSVAQVRGFVMTEVLKQNYPQITVIEVENVIEALKLVSGGLADAYIGTVPISSYNIATEGLNNLVVAGTTPFVGDISMGVRKGLPILASVIQKAMASIPEERKLSIIGDWVVLRTAQKADYTLLIQISGVAVLIVLLVLLWNSRLRKEVSRRKESEERFRQIAETVDGLFFIASPTMDEIVYMSPNFEGWSNFSCKQICDNALLWLEMVHPEDSNFYKQSIKRTVESDFKINFPNFRIIHRDGSVRWLTNQLHPVYDEDGQIKNIIGFTTDITESVTSSKKLDEIKNQFQNAFAYAVHGMALISLDGRFIRVNDALCNRLGYSDNELLKLSVMQIVHKDDLKITVSLLKEILDGTRETVQLEERYVCAGGSIVPVHFNASLVKDQDGNPVHFVAQIQDLSELKEREEQLRHSQKMDAVGKLTGGIAHDFNNILGIILGNLEIIDSTLPENEKQKNRVQKAIKSVDRGSNLIKKLLSFSRNSSPDKNLINVNECLDGFNEVIVKAFTSSVKIIHDYDENIWPIEIDVHEFEDAILNIVLNARDAMEKGGELSIKTENIILDEKYVSHHPDSKIGDHVLITLSDTGEGIEPDLLEKVLEPFYTTKSINKGTGLGLSMIHGFVQRSEGHLRITSIKGKGTSINLYIPRSYKKHEVEKDIISSESNLPKGNETILVVDDEQYLCEVAEQQLQSLGYSVFTAKDTDSALEIINGNNDIDLLFSDIVMPDNQDGYQMAQSARDIRPSLKVLLTSGYVENSDNIGDQTKDLKSLKQNTLPKPYSQQDLAFAIRRSLDS